MKARQLISNASYGPEELKALFKAFDEAWQCIAADFGDNPLAIEAARLRLANTILGLTRHGEHDPERIRDAALRIVALDRDARRR
jgi:hypothetical protein